MEGKARNPERKLAAPRLRSHHRRMSIRTPILAVVLALPLPVIGQVDPEAPATEQKAEPEDVILDPQGRRYCAPETGLMSERVLRAAGEESLEGKEFSDRKILRLVICPTFEKPLVLRLYRREGAPFLAIRRLSGLGGYELGKVELTGEVAVEPAVFEKLFAAATADTLTGLSKMTCERRSATANFDGTWWSMEIRTPEGLRTIDLTSPRSLEEDATDLSPYLTKQAVLDLIEFAKELHLAAGMKLPG